MALISGDSGRHSRRTFSFFVAIFFDGIQNSVPLSCCKMQDARSKKHGCFRQIKAIGWAYFWEDVTLEATNGSARNKGLAEGALRDMLGKRAISERHQSATLIC